VSLSAAAVGLAFALDATVGEPPERLHPVVWFGRVVGPIDREWDHPRVVGTAAALALPAGAALAVGGAVALAGLGDPLAAALVAGLALFATTSLRRLLVVAREVTAASADNLNRAREQLRALAGRDAATLSAGRVRSAVVESVAENLADGLVAPLGAFALVAATGARVPAASSGTAGGLVGDPAVVALALGAAAAAWVKAVNTMDSMLGYRSKPVGWAPARLDDAVMWLPARASAALLAVACLAPAAPHRARRWVADVPSPNSGWPMGAVAAALDVRLEKPGVYVLNPDAALPTVADARRAVRRTGVAGGLAYLGAGVVAWA
jgi:adenosylcobinamide-phosphate synthase